jgi:hypothetical protein
VTTVVVLVIGVLSLALALYGGFVSVSVIEGQAGNQEEQHTSEQRYYLLGMIGVVVLVARLLNVPIFFWMLQSLVPYCPGAMCVYGVVNVGSPYSTLSLMMKLILPFIYGLWIVFEFSNRKQPKLPFTRNLARSFLLALLPLVLVDSALDVLLVASIRPVYAPCCSSVYDINPPFSPSAIFGPGISMLIVLLTVIGTLVLISVQWFSNKSKHVPIATLILSLIISLLYLVTLHDTLAPIVLGLTDHHCPYCLFQEFPDTAFFAGLFWIGVASAGWRASLEMVWGRSENESDNYGNISRYLLKISSVCLLFSIVSLISHILVAV